jgi:hypothetical protein
MTADAQFCVARVMRPIDGFEDIYEGTPASEPIYLFPEGKYIDPLAERKIPGYDPLLARALPVPYGARLSLHLPNVYYVTLDVVTGYTYALIWRMRNVLDFRQSRIPFHFPRSTGEPDTTKPVGEQSRVPLPASYNTIGYIQSEPNPAERSLTNIHAEDLPSATTPLALPKLSGGRVQPIQQGILDPAKVADANKPTHMVHEVQSQGDDLLLAVFRNNVSVENWSFSQGSADYRFSQLFGVGTGGQLPNEGVYVLPGMAP